MKKIASAFLCMAIMFTVCTVSANEVGEIRYYSDKPFEGLKNVTLRFVDKDDVPVINAEVRFTSLVGSNNRVWIRGSDKTNAFGEVNLYDCSKTAEAKKPVDKFPVSIFMPDYTKGYAAAYTEEKFNIDLTKKKSGDKITFKLKGKTTVPQLHEAPNRADIYVLNSKHGPVQNMMVYISYGVPYSTKPDPEEAPSGYTPGNIFGYTDKNGRVTFPKLAMYANRTYEVHLSWADGSYYAGDIEILDKTGISEFGFGFDETLLEKK